MLILTLSLIHSVTSKMQFNSAVLLAIASATYAAAEDVTLSVVSDNSEIKGHSISNTHEGAGMNYLFIFGSDGPTYDYDAAKKPRSQPVTGSFFQYLSAMEHFMAMSVSTSEDAYTFEGDLLALNGSTKNFYACKNTGDPYEFSANSYEVMYYASGAPSSCISIELSKAGSSNSSSSDGAGSGSSAGESTAYTNATDIDTVTCTETKCQVPKSTSAAVKTGTATDIDTVTCTEAKCSAKASSTLSTSAGTSSASNVLTTFSAAAGKVESKDIFALGLAAILALL